MARYIKVNPKVVKYLSLENDRNQVKDGNYLLWQSDILAFGRLAELPDILAQIGGIALQAHEARQEQDGTTVRELPTATDSRFVEKTEETEEENGNIGEGEELPENPETDEQPKDEVEPTKPEGEEQPKTDTETTNENTEGTL